MGSFVHFWMKVVVLLKELELRQSVSAEAPCRGHGVGLEGLDVLIRVAINHSIDERIFTPFDLDILGWLVAPIGQSNVEGVKTLQGLGMLDVSMVAVGARVQWFNGFCGSECYIFVPSESLISSITIGLPRFFISIPHPLEVVPSHLRSHHIVIYDTRTCVTVLFHR